MNKPSENKKSILHRVLVVAGVLFVCLTLTVAGAKVTNNFSVTVMYTEIDEGEIVQVKRDFFGKGNTLTFIGPSGNATDFNIKNQLGEDFDISGLTLKKG